MPIDEKAISEKYDLLNLNVISSSQISNRATAIISKLGTATDTNGKPTIIAMRAKSREANKLISIVEIAKRELKASGTKCFQYNALGSEMTEIDRKPDMPAKKGVKDKPNEEGEESDDGFQTMWSEKHYGPKKRLVPMMTIYLSAVSVKELKAAHREQC